MQGLGSLQSGCLATPGAPSRKAGTKASMTGSAVITAGRARIASPRLRDGVNDDGDGGAHAAANGEWTLFRRQRSRSNRRLGMQHRRTMSIAGYLWNRAGSFAPWLPSQTTRRAKTPT